MMADLNIGTINMRSLSPGKLAALEEHVRESKVDIICLTETHLSPEVTFKLKGGSVEYQIFRRDRPAQRPGGGVLIACSPELGAVAVTLPRTTNGTEAMAVEVALSRRETVCVCVVYHPDGRYPMDYALLQYLEATYNRLVVCGDFNAKHTSWGVNNLNNANGIRLKAFIDQRSQLVMIEPGTATYISPVTGTGSTLDLFLVSPGEAINCDAVVLEDIGSDHLPVVMNLAGRRVPRIPPCERFDFKHAQWEAYSERLEGNLRVQNCHELRYETAQDVDSGAMLVTTCIERAASDHIPVKRVLPNRRNELPRYVLNLIRDRSLLLRRIARGEFNLRPERNRLSRLIDKEVRAFKVRNWQRMCDSIDEDNPHRIFNIVSGRTRSRTPVIKVNGATLRSSDEKTEAFADHLLDSYRPQDSPHFPIAHIDAVSRYVGNSPRTFEHLQHVNQANMNGPLIADISVEEIRSCLKTAPNRCPGPDRMHNIMLRKGPLLLLSVLAKIYSACLALGHMPAEWKQAETVMIPKPGKDHSKTDAYRPISLLPVLAKLLEKIITRRLVCHLEALGVLNKYQSGFRQDRSCNDHLLRLSQAVSVAFNKRLKVVAVFLDVAKAFDSVWHDGLRYKLCQEQFRLPQGMIRFLSGYLRGRKFRVRCEEAISGWHPIHAGVPQGGSLSPLLYLLYVNDIPIVGDRHTEPSQYADDLALWAISAKPLLAIQRLQEKLEPVVKWCDKWRIVLNATKSQSIVFTKQYQRLPDTEGLIIRGDLIPIIDRVKFLGVWYDRGLTFTPHVVNLVKACKSRLNVLSLLCGDDFGPTTEIAVRLYKTFVRPLLEYGAPAWNTSICPTQQLALETVQNRGCRTALRFPWWAPRTQLRTLCRLQLIEDRLAELGARYLLKASQRNPLIREMVDLSQTFVPDEHWTPTPVERHLALIHRVPAR